MLRLVRALLASRKTPLRARASLKRQRAAIVTLLDRVRDWLDTQEPAGDLPRDESPPASRSGERP